MQNFLRCLANRLESRYRVWRVRRATVAEGLAAGVGLRGPR